MEKILPVMVDCPAERQAPDRVWQRGVMHLKVPDSALGHDFVGLFAGTTADATVVPDFLSVVWRKLCFNSAGVLSALVLQPAGVVRGEDLGEAALQIIRECVAVARAEGAQLEENVADVVLAAQRAAPADSINSMLADRQAGRPVEIDARNGVIVRLGRKHGIATPANSMAVALMEVMSPAKIGASPVSTQTVLLK
jgi:2-dehydropantoate 2-reductase